MQKFFPLFFLTLFLIASIIHLYASHVSNQKLRAQTKGFIVPALLGWYCCLTPAINFLVVGALFFSWLGDVLLIRKGLKWFCLGGGSFFFSHIFFVLCYCLNTNFSILPAGVIVFAAICYYSFVFYVFRRLKPSLYKVLYHPMLFYLLINGTMNCFALFQLYTHPCIGTLLTVLGAGLFLTSDSLLFYVRFKKNSRFQNHFWVMLTYILSEFLIVWSFLLLQV